MWIYDREYDIYIVNYLVLNSNLLIVQMYIPVIKYIVLIYILMLGFIKLSFIFF